MNMLHASERVTLALSQRNCYLPAQFSWHCFFVIFQWKVPMFCIMSI